MKIGALFAGYGGLDLAVSSVLGGELAWYAEIERGALQVLRHRFPGIPNIGDVTTADWSAVERVDVLTGGSPCQDLSTAGRRAGMTEGTRSNLWVAMREAIARLRPPLVVWENVRGAYSAEAASAMVRCPGCLGDDPARPVLRALGRVLGDLASLGYDARWFGLRAADVGAPHERLRVFLLAYPRGSAFPELIRAARLIGGGLAGLLPTPVGDGHTMTRSGSRSDELLLPGAARAVSGYLPTPTTEAQSRTHKAGNPTLMGAVDGIDEKAAARLGVKATEPIYLPTVTATDSERRHISSKWQGGAALPTVLGVAKVLPTPSAGDGAPAQPAEAREERGHGSYLNDLPLLLPTPNGFHMGNGEEPQEWLDRRADVEERTGTRHGPALPVVARSIAEGHPLGQDGTGPKLFQTPKSTNNENRPSPSYNGGVGWQLASEQISAESWGPYAECVSRWEQIQGPVPVPTVWDADRQRADLNPVFVEWMMGLPPGWVTAPDIWDDYTTANGRPASAQYVRRAQLHALGNGVCPPQAAAALTGMLRLEVEPWHDGLVVA